MIRKIEKILLETSSTRHHWSNWSRRHPEVWEDKSGSYLVTEEEETVVKMSRSEGESLQPTDHRRMWQEWRTWRRECLVSGMPSPSWRRCSYPDTDNRGCRGWGN